VLKLEVISVPVADVDAAIRFYVDQVGFVLDEDHRSGEDFRVVQLTPRGSACSVHLVRAPNQYRLDHLVLVTDDIDAAASSLAARGVAVGEIRHRQPLENWAGDSVKGLDPERRDYSSFVSFNDPDGNAWRLQEVGFRSRSFT